MSLLGVFAPDSEPGLALVNSVVTGPQNVINTLTYFVRKLAIDGAGES